MPNFNISLEIEDIGPHTGEKSIHFQDEVTSNQIAIYAPNGTGKTFISRMFRLAAPDIILNNTDYLISIGKSSGRMRFCCGNDNQLSVSIESGQSAVVSNDTDYIFCTFNSDYVDENIRANNYNPDGNVTGYILGKIQIDLTQSRRNEEILKSEIEKLKEEISSLIDEKKNDLRKAGVTSNTKEISLFSFDNVRNNTSVECSFSISEIENQLDSLKNLPENMPDISVPVIRIDESVYESAFSVLSTEYPNAEWDEEFITYYQRHSLFIQEGLKLISSNLCPFCREPLTDTALDIIEKYRDFECDKKTQTIREIQVVIENIKKNIEDIKNFSLEINKSCVDLQNFRKYFHSLDQFSLELFELDEFSFEAFNEIIKALERKCLNLPALVPVSDDSFEKCKHVIQETNRIKSSNDKLIVRINQIKNDSNAERLRLRKNLCNATFLSLQSELRSKFLDLENKEANLRQIQEQIKTKEEQTKISKKKKIYQSLTRLLDNFFLGKYTVDEDSFYFRLNDISINNKASNVLSDGEKSVVAFCLFLANIHRYIEREDDYNRLFLVIDDPISSMDFHYVYALSNLLRNMNSLLGVSVQHNRIWIFTHNLEFFSILQRNRIIGDKCAFEMRPGSIGKIDHRLLMPYENHLRDIVRVAHDEEEPSHTTPNSIRHVIETVCHFEYPEKNLEKFVNENELLSSNATIYTLCQDLSHGNIREEFPYSSDLLREACRVLVHFMDEKYPGQVGAIH